MIKMLRRFLPISAVTQKVRFCSSRATSQLPEPLPIEHRVQAKGYSFVIEPLFFAGGFFISACFFMTLGYISQSLDSIAKSNEKINKRLERMNSDIARDLSDIERAILWLKPTDPKAKA